MNRSDLARKALRVSNIAAMAAGYLLLVFVVVGIIVDWQSEEGLKLSRADFRDPVHAAVTSDEYEWTELSDDDSLQADAQGVHLSLSGPADDIEWALLELYTCECDNSRTEAQSRALVGFAGVAFPDLDAPAWLQKLNERSVIELIVNDRRLSARYAEGRIKLTIQRP